MVCSFCLENIDDQSAVCIHCGMRVDRSISVTPVPKTVKPAPPVPQPEETVATPVLQEPEIVLDIPEEPALQQEAPIVIPEAPVLEPEVPIVIPEKPLREPEISVQEPVAEPEFSIPEPEIPVPEPVPAFRPDMEASRPKRTAPHSAQVVLQPAKKSKVGAVFAGFVIAALVALIALLLGAAAFAALTLYGPDFEIMPQAASPNYETVISTEGTVSTDGTLSTVPPDDGREYLILWEREGNIFCYHIPVVNLDIAAEINEEMYSTHSSHIEEMVYNCGDYPFLMQMTYSVYRKGDIVSVMVQEFCDTDCTYFYVYNFSATTGENVSDQEVFAAFGLSEAEGRTRIKESLTQYWDAYCEEMGSEYKNDFLQEVIDKTLDNSNIQACKPFIDENGNLRYTGSIYSLGGADSYDWIFDDNGNTWRDRCQVQHSS